MLASVQQLQDDKINISGILAFSMCHSHLNLEEISELQVRMQASGYLDLGLVRSYPKNLAMLCPNFDLQNCELIKEGSWGNDFYMIASELIKR